MEPRLVLVPLSMYVQIFQNERLWGCRLFVVVRCFWILGDEKIDNGIFKQIFGRLHKSTFILCSSSAIVNLKNALSGNSKLWEGSAGFYCRYLLVLEVFTPFWPPPLDRLAWKSVPTKILRIIIYLQNFSSILSKLLLVS